MNITDVRVRKIAKEGKMKAVVSITIDDEFVVHDIKVIEGEKGLFIAMPSRKASDGEYRDIAHPINSQTRDHIQSLILEKYQTERNWRKLRRNNRCQLHQPVGRDPGGLFFCAELMTDLPGVVLRRKWQTGFTV